MTKSNYNNKTAKSSKAEAKRPVCCRDCFWADLLRYGDNPVLADCRQKPTHDGKFPFDRDVASTMKYCAMHEHQDEGEKSVQQRVSVRRHPMAAYARTNTAEREAA